jgi:DNA adenine methylase
MTTINYEKPLLKWVGGKTQILDKVLNTFPKVIENYHELFLGGGSVLLGVLSNTETIKIKKEIFAYDYNETLINFYKNIQKKPKQFLIEIDKIINIYNNIINKEINRKALTIEEALTSQESYYYWTRKKYNTLSQEDKNSIIGSALFLFLNKTCFRGIFREGPNGFNVPFGHYKTQEIVNKEHVLKISKLIKDVKFAVLSFEQSIIKALDGDFVYCDPPYVPVNNKSFVGYTLCGFEKEQHELLFKLCKELIDKNIKFVMSNSYTNLIKEHFNDLTKYEIQIIECKRSINSKNPAAKINEVIIKSI